MNTGLRLEIFVEEASAERLLVPILPKMIDVGTPTEFHVYRGRPDLLRRLPGRLRSYSSWATAADIGIVVLLDRDNDDCRELKKRLEGIAGDAGLPTLATPGPRDRPTVVNRIAVEELEAWLLGDLSALRAAYPRLPSGLAEQARFRDPENITGGTWEALEHLLQRYGYYRAGLRKAQLAAEVAPHLDVERNRSRSFQVFRDGVRRLRGEVPRA